MDFNFCKTLPYLCDAREFLAEGAEDGVLCRLQVVMEL